MSTFLKKLPIDYYGRIRFAKAYILQKKSIIPLSSWGKNIWFLDAPAYGNMGDQAIAFAIHEFCKSIFPDYTLIEFQEDNVIQYLHWLKQHVKKEDLIVLQGGGNLGNLYPRYEYVRRTIVRNFPMNKIIIFPQSVHFSDTTAGKREAEVSRKTYKKSNHVHLFARDSVSYSKMKNLFPETQVDLCPDIVFSLNGIVSSRERNGLGICIRNDQEKSVSDNSISKIVSQVATQSKQKKRFDTVVDVDGPVVGEFRKSLLISKLKEFAECELVITDRLHGMIFSYITSTPCISVENSTGKSFFAYNDWLQDSANVTFARNQASQIKVPKNVDSHDLDFNVLKKTMLEWNK